MAQVLPGGRSCRYLLLEFQSSVDRFMALRLMVYVGLLYQQLLRGGQVGGEASLPPVLPMVLYHGERPWTAPTDVGDLVVDVPGGLADYRPRMRYLLLEERAYREPDLAAMRNLVAALFRLENSRDAADVRRVVDALAAWLRSGLARACVDWLREILLPSRMREAELPRLEDFTKFGFCTFSAPQGHTTIAQQFTAGITFALLPSSPLLRADPAINRWVLSLAPPGQ